MEKRKYWVKMWIFLDFSRCCTLRGGTMLATGYDSALVVSTTHFNLLFRGFQQHSSYNNTDRQTITNLQIQGQCFHEAPQQMKLHTTHTLTHLHKYVCTVGIIIQHTIHYPIIRVLYMHTLY